MKKFVCIKDNVFFNKTRYYNGDVITVDDELAKDINKSWFETEEEYRKNQQKVTEKIKTAEKEGKSIKDVLKEAEEEKKILSKNYEAKIEKLEKQLNPKVKNDL